MREDRHTDLPLSKSGSGTKQQDGLIVSVAALDLVSEQKVMWKCICVKHDTEAQRGFIVSAGN